MCAGDDVEQVFDDTVGDEGLVVIQPPRVGSAPGEDLEALLDGMVAPNAAVERGPFFLRCARPANVRSVGNPVAAVQPAVRSPGQVIEDVVLSAQAPAIENNFRWASRLVFTWTHRHK